MLCLKERKGYEEGGKMMMRAEESELLCLQFSPVSSNGERCRIEMSVVFNLSNFHMNLTSTRNAMNVIV